MSAPSVSETLGAFVAGTDRFDDALIHDAKRALLNFAGGVLGVCHDPAVEDAAAVLATFAGSPTAALFGRQERVDPMSAAFVNAIAANLLDYDDTHLATVIHPAAPVAAPVLALAEQRGASGLDVLHAYLLGAEVECRIGNAVSPGHYARGWHITATCGVFGAAAAAARLIGLDARRTAHALGIAASQSAGLVENLPTAAKNVGVGNAARSGILAALLAERGYEAAPAAIEGPLGWARATGDAPRIEAIVHALGNDWEAAKNAFKPYPCGIVMHAVIDACFELRERHGIAADDVRAVMVRGDSLLLARGDRAVNNERDARVSIHHCVAAPFLRGRAGVDEFAHPFAMSDEAVEFRSRVSAALDPSMPTGAAAVTVTTMSGAEHEAVVTHARGSLERPLDDADLEAKVRDLVAIGGSGCDAARVTETIWRLDEAPDPSSLVDALTP